MCNINLFNLLQNNPTSGGSWTQVQGTTVIPVVNNVINTNNAATGLYEFEYTVGNGACIASESVYLEMKDSLLNIIMPICINDSLNIFSSFVDYYDIQHNDTQDIQSGYFLTYAAGSPTNSNINLSTGEVTVANLPVNVSYIINVNLEDSACSCISTVTLINFGCTSIQTVINNCSVTYNSTCTTGVTTNVYIEKLNTVNSLWEIVSTTVPYTIASGVTADYRTRIMTTYALTASYSMTCENISPVVNYVCAAQMCDTCNLSMVTVNNNIGLLDAGSITSNTCTVGNYAVEWYLNSVSPANFQFTSGNSANSDPAIEVFHPFTGVSAIPVIGGTYIPVIKYITLDSVLYAPTAIPNSTLSLDLTSCLSNVTIINPGCTNSFNTSTFYSHEYVYTALTNFINASKTLYFEPSNTTQYLAYRFKCFNISDRIQLYSLLTGVESLIDDVVIGQDVPTTNVTTVPKVIQDEQAKGIIELPAYNPNRVIKIVITPSYYVPSNQNTSWELGLKCLDGFDCNINLPSSYYNGLFTKVCSSNTALCTAANRVTFNFFPTQYNYLGFRNIADPVIQTSSLVSYTLSGYAQSSCVSLTGTVTYVKSGSTLNITFSNQTHYNTYKAQAIAASSNCGSNSNSNITFYNSYDINIRLENNCGDASNSIKLATRACNSPTFNDATRTITVSFSIVAMGMATGTCINEGQLNTLVTKLNSSFNASSFNHTKTVADSSMFAAVNASIANPTNITTNSESTFVYYYESLIATNIRNCLFVQNCNVNTTNSQQTLTMLDAQIIGTNPSSYCNNFRVLLRPLSNNCVSNQPYNLIYEMDNGVQIFP